MWTVNFQMFKLVLEKAEEPEIKLKAVWQDEVESGISRYWEDIAGQRVEKYSKHNMQIKLNNIHSSYMICGVAKILSTIKFKKRDQQKECFKNIPCVILWTSISQRKDSNNGKKEDGM